MRKRALGLLALIIFAIPAVPATVHAADQPAKGLSITPVRQFVQLNAGGTSPNTITIGNTTDKPLTVDLSVQKFTVADYTYNYQFSKAEPNWVHPATNQITLQPHESKKVDYKVALPSSAAPGGRYYLLVASSTFTDVGLPSTVQAATLIYLTVNGKITRTSHVTGSNMPHVILGSTIPYYVDVKNTGNVHYFAYFTDSLAGLAYKNNPTGTSHLLMPGKIRRVSGAITTPLLPGIYNASFGYKTDSGETFRSSQFVLFIPPWFWAVAVFAAYVAYRIWKRRQQRKPAKHIEETE